MRILPRFWNGLLVRILVKFHASTFQKGVIWELAFLGVGRGYWRWWLDGKPKWDDVP